MGSRSRRGRWCRWFGWASSAHGGTYVTRFGGAAGRRVDLSACTALERPRSGLCKRHAVCHLPLRRVPGAARAIGHLAVRGRHLGARKRRQVQRVADLAAFQRVGRCSGVGGVVQIAGRVRLPDLDAAGVAADAFGRTAAIAPPRSVGEGARRPCPCRPFGSAVLVTAILRSRRGQSPGFGLQDLIGIGAGHYRGIAAAIGAARPRLLDELAAQLSWPVTVIGLMGLAAAVLLNDWRQRWLVTVGAVPMLAIGLLSDFWFSRYLLFTLPPLIVCAVAGWRNVALRAKAMRRPIEVGTLAVCVGFMGHQSALIIFDPASANWSPVDRFQYLRRRVPASAIPRRRNSFLNRLPGRR